MKAEPMAPCLHQLAHFRRGMRAPPEKYIGGFAICVQDAKDDLQLVEVTQPFQARQVVVRAEAAGKVAQDSLFPIRAVHIDSHNERHAPIPSYLPAAIVRLPASGAAAWGVELGPSSITWYNFSLSVSQDRTFANSAAFLANSALFPGSA